MYLTVATKFVYIFVFIVYITYELLASFLVIMNNSQDNSQDNRQDNSQINTEGNYSLPKYYPFKTAAVKFKL